MKDIDVYIIDNFDSFKELVSVVDSNNYEYVSFDLETDSVIEKKAKIYGIGISFTANEAYYIPIRSPSTSLLWTNEELNEIYFILYKWFQKHKLIGWNLIYDALVFEYNTGRKISDYIYSDGILQKHTLDEERPFGLKEVAVKYLGDWADKAQSALLENIKKNGGKTTKDEMEMYKADTDVLAEYCGWDTVLARRLFDIFEPRLKEEGVYDLFYKEEIMPLYKEVTIDMKRQGFHVDVDYFKQLHRDISSYINDLESEIISDINEHTKEFTDDLLNKNYPVGNTGSFPKLYAEQFNIPLPNKAGKVTMARKEIEKIRDLHPEFTYFYDWVLDPLKHSLEASELREVQEKWYFKDNPDARYLFNLKSNDHLGWLFFSKLGEEPLAKTEKGKPKCDDDFLESIKTQYPFVFKLIDLKKLSKLSSTYIEGILERQVDGIIYASMLQFGTTSGRYSSTNPNCQNLPRVKDEESDLTPLVLKFVNAIKRGFIAPKGYKLVNADYSSLEPVCFAHASGDEKLREVFRKGFDLYSAIAIEVFGVEGCSANKKDKNYLKNKHPELRQKAKVFCLAVVYGAEAGRISQAMNIDYQSAAEIIESYLDAYPELRKYMERCDYQATKYGFVRSDFGRIRHLPKAKELHSRWGNKLIHNRKWVKENGLDDIRYTLKNSLNNSKNFPIQGLAAHIVNRAMIQTNRQFKQNNIDGWICMTVHDEICCVVKDEHVAEAVKILRECMEHTTKLSVPLYAEPLVASNWADAK